jgi:hypothetical protein
MKHLGKHIISPLIEVLIDVTLGPLGALLRVTAGARIGRADLRGKRGTREPESMVCAFIDHHVGALRHVTVGTEAAIGPGLVKIMLRVVIGRGFVASGAQRVALGTELSGVSVVTVAADHARRVHPALQERSVDIDLVFDLTVVEVEELVQGGEAIPVMVARSVPAEVGAPGMTGRAGRRFIAWLRGGKHRDVASFDERPLSFLGRRETAVEAGVGWAAFGLHLLELDVP